MAITGARVLIVDDDPASRRLLEVRLRPLECDVATAGNGEQALTAIRKDLPDLVLLDLQMPRVGGIEVLRALRKEGINLPIIVITAHGSIETAVEAMKEGAHDFITKPVDAKHFDIVVRKALEREGLKRELGLFSEDADKRYRLVIGKSEKIMEAVETARKAATSKATVLLLGESGTGKEVFARAIHNWSERKIQPFVAINCVGLSKELLESELFGHEKGAFTGADQVKKGKMELANGGTVFLDEVGDVSQELQTKLLRFLQEREFDRVGGVRPIHVDVRIIAATNRDLEVSVREGRFREDLFHRLNVIPINLPCLRERKEDILALSQHFLHRYALESKKNIVGITKDALEKLAAYHWPGNVRELANVIERAVVLGNGQEVTLGDLPRRIVALEQRTESGKVSYRAAMEAARRDLVTRALAESRGNRAAAARMLGLHEKYFLRLLKSLGIAE
ncbi:MAG: sigma-54-dependent Fis family transcriptional regulator [Deltaproteobacteria bacterium]|nr:sigma-54-dependent Fis family transcriptional regulator [Deltaproteobacteria bacterium]